MAVSDPIADMLTRVRNVVMARHDTVQMPVSRMKLYIAKILKQEGFISNYEVMGEKPHRQVKIHLKYDEKNAPFISGIERISKPGLRIYVHKGEISRVYGGLGISVVSTSSGVMTGQQAWRKGKGGELLCKVC